MKEKSVNNHDANTRLSRLIARVEREQLIVTARAGKRVAKLRPVRKTKKGSHPFNDALLHIEEYSYDGPIGRTANQDIDRTVYDI